MVDKLLADFKLEAKECAIHPGSFSSSFSTFGCMLCMGDDRKNSPEYLDKYNKKLQEVHNKIDPRFIELHGKLVEDIVKELVENEDQIQQIVDMAPRN